MRRIKVGDVLEANQWYICYGKFRTVLTQNHTETVFKSITDPVYELDFIGCPEMPLQPEVGKWYIMTDRYDGNALLLRYNGDDRPTVDLDGDDAAMPEEYKIGDEWVKVKL